MHHTVEIFPQDKACNADCPGCNMAKRGLHRATTQVSQKVIDTFNAVQKNYTANNIPWGLVFMSDTNEAVAQHIDVNESSSLKRLSFHGGDILDTNDAEKRTLSIASSLQNIRNITNNVDKQMLETLKLKVGLRKKHLLLTAQEKEYILGFFDKYLDFTIDHNIKKTAIGIERNINKVSQILKYQDEIEKEFFDMYAVFKKRYRNISITESNTMGGEFYAANHCEQTLKYHKPGQYISYIGCMDVQHDHDVMTITQRLIGGDSNQNLLEDYQRAQGFVSDPEASGKGNIAIYPHGVMIGHSPTQINNLFLYTSHERLLSFLDENSGSSGVINYTDIVKENIESFNDSKKNLFDKEHLSIVNPK